MRIILVEFTWQAEEIVNNKQYYKNDVVVSLHPESSYIFKFNKISYFENYEFCKHSELWPKYKNITERSIKITKVLDEALHNIDKRFKDLNWNFFDDYHYPLKIAFDQMFYYAELISKLIEKFNPTEIIVADTGKILIGTNFLVSTKISVIKYLLKTYENTGSKIKIGFVFPKKEKFTNHFSNNLKRFMLSLKISVKKKLINTYYNLSFFTNYYTSKPKYLAVGSFEVIKYKKMYPKESKFFLNYNKYL